MPIPEKIKVLREEDYHTHNIGRYDSGNQFMGFVTATLVLPLSRDWQKHKRWYAVLHRFDADGRHLGTEAWFAGTTADGQDEVVAKAKRKLAEMLQALGPIAYCDVEVGLFAVEIDGHTFGLVDASEPEEGYEAVHLVPNELAFFAPWDGEYDT